MLYELLVYALSVHDDKCYGYIESKIFKVYELRNKESFEVEEELRL